jgi:hypothetical protein
VSAWEHASPDIQQHIDQLKELNSSRRAYLEFQFQQHYKHLSLADVIALGQHLSASEVVEFVRVVDPWLYFGETTKATAGARSVVQSALDKASNANREFHSFTEESKTTYLLSRILIKKRPALIRKSRAKAAGVPTEMKTHVLLGILPASVLLPCAMLQGMCHGSILPQISPLLACESHPPSGALQEGLPEAKAAASISTPERPTFVLHVPTSPTPTAPSAKPLQKYPSPVQRFQVGECIRVLANTTPGIHPTHATGILSATIVRIKGPNEYLVRAGGADHANSRLVSDEVMVSLLPGMTLAPILRPPSFVVHCYKQVKACSYNTHNHDACLCPMGLHDPFQDRSRKQP